MVTANISRRPALRRPLFIASHRLLTAVFFAAAAAAALLLPASAARAGFIFVANNGAGTVGLYTDQGAPVNPNLITGLQGVYGLTVSGTDLYVTTFGSGIGASGKVGRYKTWGTAVNPSLVTGLTQPVAVAVYGTNLLVSSGGGDYVGLYHATSGQTIDAQFVHAEHPEGLAVSGSELYVGTFLGKVGKYDLATGAAINASLLSNLGPVFGITISGTDLYVVKPGLGDNGIVGKYTTSGGTTNASLVSGLQNAHSVAVAGSDLFVSEFHPQSNIGRFDSSTGAAKDRFFIFGSVSRPYGIAYAAEIPEPAAASSIALAALALGATARKRRTGRRTP